MTSMPPTNPREVELVLRCPKCHGEMVSFERSGVRLDQCRECRGVYLDRGELERIVDAEAARTGPDRWADDRRPRGPEPRGDRADWGRHDDDDDDRRPRDQWRDSDDRWNAPSGDGRRPQKRRSLLGELLEGFGD